MILGVNITVWLVGGIMTLVWIWAERRRPACLLKHRQARIDYHDGGGLGCGLAVAVMLILILAVIGG